MSATRLADRPGRRDALGENGSPRAAWPVLLQRIHRLVFPHAFAEETLLWPAVRRVLPEGERLTPMVEEEHQQVDELAAELDRTPLSDPTRLDTAARGSERLRPCLESASRLLGRWAAAVECVRVLRRGERPETRTR